MRIGIDGRLWNETGVGRYIRNLVEQLQELDKTNEYVLFLRSQDAAKFKVQSSKFKVIATDIHWHSLNEQVRFPQVLYKENLDLMHFTYFSLPIFYNKPFVVTIHDLIVNHFPTGKASTLPYPLYQLKRVGYTMVMEHAIRNSRKIIVPLHAVKDDVVQTFTVSENKIAVTYEGNSNLKTQNSKVPFENYFLYVGNAYPHKNLELLVDAFVLFKREINDDVKLVLVGKDDYFYRRLRDKIERQKFENIVVKHDVSDQELFALYSHAKGFVSASLMEGFGLPPLEAMGSGTPVILSDIPAFREVCQDAAWYFDPAVKTSLTEQLHFLYNVDHKAREQKIKKGLERVQQFSWRKMAEQTLKVYESSISVRSG